MTLDEAIQHAEEVAETACVECADNHRQLAAWLRDYKRLLEQEPKTGYWIDLTGLFFCSECDGGFAKAWNYCPSCGARMVEPQESEE